MNIFIPFNDPNTFIVENNYTISVLKSLKEVKAFLHSLIFIQELYAEVLNTDAISELADARNSIDQLTLRNEELTEMVGHRNKAISELSSRIRVAEELILAGPDSSTKYMFAGNIITLGGVSYPMDNFPANFITKAKNVIANSAGKIKPL